MASKRVSFRQLPDKIRILAGMHQDPNVIEIHECKDKQDLYDLSSRFPFETTCVANNANETKTIVGWYMVGLSVPGAADDFKRPVMAYYYMSDADWRAFGEDIKREVDRRKKLYNETKTGFRNLIKGS